MASGGPSVQGGFAGLIESTVNVAERVTGLDLDGDGDIGQQGKMAKAKKAVLKIKKKYEQSDEHPYQCFKLASCCSWCLILVDLLMFIFACASVAAADRAAAVVCREPEIQAGLVNGTSTCKQALSCFVGCLDQNDVVTSKNIRSCLIGDADPALGLPISIDSPCTYASGALAYTLGQRYRNSSVSIATARFLLIEEIKLEMQGRRLAAAPDGMMAVREKPLQDTLPQRRSQLMQPPQLPTNLVALAWGVTSAAATHAHDAAMSAALDAASRLGVIRGAPVPPPDSGSDGAGGELAERLSRRRLAKTEEQQLLDVYVNGAAAAGIAYLGTGTLSYTYGWVAAVAVLLAVPPLLALWSLGVLGRHICAIPWHVEEMHNRSMCWACYLTVLTGLIGIFLCSGALTKFQILMRYYNDPASGCARVQDPDSCLSSSTSSGSSRLMQALAMDNAMALAAMPCILGILGSFCPVLYAMVLARSRVIRADAMDRDLGNSRRLHKRNKDLTGPQPVLQGPPPNLAMLNPVIERNTSTSSGEYSPNYHAGPSGTSAPDGAPGTSAVGGTAASRV